MNRFDDVWFLMLLALSLVVLLVSLATRQAPVSFYAQEPDCAGKQLVYVLKADGDLPVWMCPR